MKDIELYRNALKVEELVKYTDAILGAIGKSLPVDYGVNTLLPMMKDLISKLEDIDRADFSDNFNANHKEENPF